MYLLTLNFLKVKIPRSVCANGRNRFGNSGCSVDNPLPISDRMRVINNSFCFVLIVGLGFILFPFCSVLLSCFGPYAGIQFWSKRLYSHINTQKKFDYCEKEKRKILGLLFDTIKKQWAVFVRFVFAVV